MNRKQFLSYDPLFSPFPRLLQEMGLEFYRNQLRKKRNILTRYSSADNLKKKNDLSSSSQYLRLALLQDSKALFNTFF